MTLLAQPRFAKKLSPTRYLSFSEIFGNENPVEVEIGSGRGQFLLVRAHRNPDINFFGVEWKGKLVRLTRSKAEQFGLMNLRFFDTDAREVMRHLPENAVSVFHIYFPDPWPKRKHLRRRLVSAEVIGLLQKKLKDGGLIEIATDSHDYFEQVKKELAESGQIWRMRESVNERLFSPDERTLFESKYAQQGKDLYYLELKK